MDGEERKEELELRDSQEYSTGNFILGKRERKKRDGAKEIILVQASMVSCLISLPTAQLFVLQHSHRSR